MRADLEHRLEFVVSECRRRMQMEFSQTTADLLHRGMASSSGAMLTKERLAEENFDKAFLDLATDVDKAAQAGVSNADREACLNEAVAGLLAAIREVYTEPASDSFGPRYGVRAEKLRELEVRGASLVRQYLAGYLTRSTPAGTSISLSIHDSPGAVVQQGGSGNVQTATVSVNIQEAQSSLQTLLTELRALPAETPGAQDALQDAEVLEQRLSRKHSDPGLVRELAKSLRNVVEGTIAGLLSGPGITAARHLWTVLGVS